jgi:UDP-N-acetylglucosamine:LPS N-acetylglucosamine transferase
MDKSSIIFGNPIASGIVKKAERQKTAYIKKFGDDTHKKFRLVSRKVESLAPLGIEQLMVQDASTALEVEWKPSNLAADPNALVIGNIRMGFGHYRISIAIASAARALGKNPYWLDLHSFKDTTGGKIIAHLNNLYSLGSRLSQKYALFNSLYWEPLNSEGFRKLSYNAADQKTAELMATPCKLLPKTIPYVATHVWPAQAAIHSGIERVVNVIPDNWPMALHLSEGAIHCVQSPSAWFGYKTLRGMAGKSIPRFMDPRSLVYTGHYIDHELVANLEQDTAERQKRLATLQPLRILLSVGGAGAQRELYARLIRTLLPLEKSGKVAILINVGDHQSVLEGLLSDIPELQTATKQINNWSDTRTFAEQALQGTVSGIHLFMHSDIFQAVYTTNLLMRASDLMVTKPSELAFYPVPKLLVRRVGGHEAWGAIRSAELGDGTFECSDPKEAESMLKFLVEDHEGLQLMNACILSASKAGVYAGAYRAVELALQGGTNE